MEISKITITKLTDENFFKWNYEINMALKAKDLWKHIEFASYQDNLKNLIDKSKEIEEEVEQCLRKRDPELLVFLSEQVLERVAKNDDLFEPVLTLKQQFPKSKDLSPELSGQFERYVPKVKPAKEGKQPRRTTTEPSTMWASSMKMGLGSTATSERLRDVDSN